MVSAACKKTWLSFPYCNGKGGKVGKRKFFRRKLIDKTCKKGPAEPGQLRTRKIIGHRTLLVKRLRHGTKSLWFLSPAKQILRRCTHHIESKHSRNKRSITTAIVSCIAMHFSTGEIHRPPGKWRGHNQPPRSEQQALICTARGCATQRRDR